MATTRRAPKKAPAKGKRATKRETRKRKAPVRVVGLPATPQRERRDPGFVMVDEASDLSAADLAEASYLLPGDRFIDPDTGDVLLEIPPAEQAARDYADEMAQPVDAPRSAFARAVGGMGEFNPLVPYPSEYCRAGAAVAATPPLPPDVPHGTSDDQDDLDDDLMDVTAYPPPPERKPVWPAVVVVLVAFAILLAFRLS